MFNQLQSSKCGQMAVLAVAVCYNLFVLWQVFVPGFDFFKEQGDGALNMALPIAFPVPCIDQQEV